MKKTIPILVLSFLLIGCEEPPVIPHADAPVPTGVIEGTVFYVGSAPECTAQGEPQGRVIMTLFAYNNPPPPVGTATSALNLYSANADQLFSSADCGNTATLHRSMPFVWPNIPLSAAAGTEVSYQIRGFYDRDEDFNPFFSVLNQPTAGDVLGGAFVDPSAPTNYAPINFGSRASNELGQVVRNITVTLGAPARTERPMFELTNPATLSSSATIPSLAPGSTNEEIALWEQGFWQQSSLNLKLLSPSENESAFNAANISLDVSSDHFAWYAKTIDLDQDGTPDPHPILGSDNNGDGQPDYYWMTPMTLFRRAQTQREIASGIPSVMLLGTPLNTQLAMNEAIGQSGVFRDNMDILVPPVALVNLNPSLPYCSVAYLAPANMAPLYEGDPQIDPPKDCQELPTGHYDVVVFHGFAGGTAGESPVPFAEDGDPIYSIDDAAFTGQVWSIPNELGPADTTYQAQATSQLAISDQIKSQGPSGRFLVADDDESDDNGRTGCDQALDIIDGAPGYRPIELMPIADACCQAVNHLCGLPLCEAEDGVREGVGSETGDPTCVPFLMPSRCCPAD